MSVPVLPPSAPFNIEQRAWLNGFFAAVFSSQSASTSNELLNVSPNGAIALESTAIAQAETVEEMPWHDSSLELDERMKLAEDKPLPLRLMAAMAQLDCGQCGYLCQSYAAALADGSEKSLKKCVPGEKPTFLKLKELMS